MSRRPTPETEAAILASEGQWSFVLKETCQRLERERDEAREKLSHAQALLAEMQDALKLAVKQLLKKNDA